MKPFGLIFLANLVIITNGNDMKKPNETLLAEEIDNNVNFTCILEGNSLKSAVTWITPFDYYTELKASRYLPNSEPLCNYKETGANKKRCIPSNWSLNQSTDFNLKPITDYRWESFPIRTSSNSKIEQIFEFPKNIFSITVSLRIQNNATMHLCNDKSGLQESLLECYLVLIDKTTISIYVKKGYKKTYLNSTTINEVKEDEWKHLIIRHTDTENRKMLTLKIADAQVTWKSEEYTPYIRYLSVQSEELSLWKLHDYWFISTNKTTEASQIGKKLPVSSSIFCVSLHVALCSTCIMNIRLDPINDIYVSEEIYSKKVENPYVNEKTGGTYSWKEVKIIRNVTDKIEFMNLYLETNNNSSKEGFWAVDDIRLCHPHEIRVSNLLVTKNIAKEIKCQPLSENSIGIYTPKPIATCKNETKIGAHCNITCESIFGINKTSCERNMICTSNDCHCALGYKGPTCKNECSMGEWGIGCNNKCGNCKNNICSPFNGTCREGCDEGFVAPNCTDPAQVHNIHTSKSTVNSITLQWDSPATSDKTFSYIVTYKHKKYIACKNDQHVATQYSETLHKKQLTVENLLPYSDYLFKVAAIFNGTEGNSTDFIGSTNCTDTTGNEEVLINVTVSQREDTFPLVLLAEPPCSNIKGPLIYEAKFKCSNDWCDQKPTNLSIPYSNKENNQKVFQQPVSTLIPYSNYVVAITSKRTHENVSKQKTLQTAFETREGKPPSVNNLIAYSRNESTISLRWKAPYPPHGRLQHYKIACIGIAVCKNIYVQQTECELWKSYVCADITNLKENTKYTVEVRPKNFAVQDYGKAEVISNIWTQENESEPPLKLQVTWDKDIAILHWDHPVVTNGPLLNFSIEINITQSEDINHTNFYTNFTIAKYNLTYCYRMLDLKYSTVYSIRVYPINKFKGKPSPNVTIKMPPPTPKLLYTPTIYCADLKCELKIAKPVNMSKSSYLYVIVDRNQTVQAEENIDTKQLLTDSTKTDESKTAWLAVAIPVANISYEFIYIKLGDGTNSTSKYGRANNTRLHSGTNYVITVVIANYFLNKSRFSQRYNLASAPEERNVKGFSQANATNAAFYALFLLLLIPIAVGGWIFYNRNNKSNAGFKIRLPSCFQKSSDLNEHLPLHSAERNIQPKPSPKPVGVVKPKNLELVDVESPLLIQENSENTQLSRKVKLEDFEEYVKQSVGTSEEDGDLVQQHSLFVRGQTKPWIYGLRKQNKFKNRYNNLIAYDHSRVKLEKLNKDDFSDYINANYVDGYKQPKAYIATQGPKPTTVCDFWRMVWQEKATTIVMVANVEEDGKKKTEEYWPKINYSLTFGTIEVYHQKTEIFSNYVFRTLTLVKDSEERTIEQLHFTSWPDHSVPLYPQTLVPFIKKVLTVPQDSAPIIVHCSAGVGRTGTIILCDFILRMAAGEGAVDFLATMQQLREQRANLVDNPNQYKLAHLVVLETLFGLDTTIVCNYELEQNIDTLIKSGGLYSQMEYLEKVVWQDQAMRSPYRSIPNPANKHKNRFSDVVPDGYGNVYISRYPVTDEHSDYINAVEVDGFHIPRRFIVTQQPLPHTLVDFWRMVSENEVTTIVSLNKIELCDESSATFWPEEDDILDLQFATLNFVEKDEYSTHNCIKIALVQKTEDQNSQYGRNINIVMMKGWPPLKSVPENLDSLMATWDEVDKISRGNNPIIVTCYDGAKACGVFVALSFVIEKIKLEQVCDVCLAVRAIRRNRGQFVTSVEQFELLYKAAIQYLKGFETYSNFPVAK